MPSNTSSFTIPDNQRLEIGELYINNTGTHLAKITGQPKILDFGDGMFIEYPAIIINSVSGVLGKVYEGSIGFKYDITWSKFTGSISFKL
jgi:hypothetical protein